MALDSGEERVGHTNLYSIPNTLAAVGKANAVEGGLAHAGGQ